MSSTVIETAKTWLGLISAVNEVILNDFKTAIQFIDGGVFFGEAEGDFEDSSGKPLDRGVAVEKMIYAASLSAVWQTGLPGEHPSPVIVLPDGIPQDGEGCISYRPADFVFEDCQDGLNCEVLDNEDAFASGFVCDGDAPLWLVGVEQPDDADCWAPCFGAPMTCPQDCTPQPVKFSPLFGIETLPDFGLTVEEAAINARLSWELHGKINNGRNLDLFGDVDETNYESLVSLDLRRAPGVSHETLPARIPHRS